MDKDKLFEVKGSEDGARLDRAIRQALGEPPWSRVRAWIRSGKAWVDDRAETDPAHRLRAGQFVAIRMSAPRPSQSGHLASESIAFADPHIVVVRKSPHVSCIPFSRGERGTLQEQVRSWLNRGVRSKGQNGGDLGVVHRIDKETSGLIVFTRTLAAKRGLDDQMRAHTVERRYLAIAHGPVRSRRIESRLVSDRGDGVRGSTTDPARGRRAVTHVHVEERLPGATLVACRLETGRTHQIRIHLAEGGNPLVGERVYVRDWSGPLIDAPRLMLHAAVLGFEHPIRRAWMRFEDPLPKDLCACLASLRRGEAQ